MTRASPGASHGQFAISDYQDCDGVPDAVDLALMIDHVFFGGQSPCY